MPADAASPEQLATLAALIDRWARSERDTNAIVAHVDHDAESRRWYIRLRGEEKDFTTIWLTLRERTLHYEAGVMPAPEENREQLFEYLLRLNNRLYGMRFAIGEEDGVYLVGQMPVASIDEAELDRIVGSTYTYVEQYFRPLMRIGYASKFKG